MWLHRFVIVSLFFMGYSQDDITEEYTAKENTSLENITENYTIKQYDIEKTTVVGNIIDEFTTEEKITEASTLEVNATKLNMVEETSTNKYAAEENIIVESTAEENIIVESTTEENIIVESTTEENIIVESTTEENIIVESTTEENIIVESTTEENLIVESTTEENIIVESTTEENIIVESTTEENIIVESTTEENIIVESTTEENIIVESTTEENVIVESTTEENVIVESTTEENVIVESTTEENVIVESTTEENIAKEYLTEKIVAEEFAPEEYTTYKPITEDYSTEEFTTYNPKTEEHTTIKEEPAEKEKKLSEYILAILEHYKDPDPLGLPGLDIPDPMPMPDHDNSISFGTTLYLKNMVMYGTSKVRILNIDADVGTMRVQSTLSVDVLQTRGNYSISTWWNSVKGPFTIHSTGIKVITKGAIGVDRDGKLQAQDININISFETISVDFQNLGFFGDIIQGFINSAGPAFFDFMKPFLINEMYTNTKTAIDDQLEKIAGDTQFPNSISPLDMVLIDLSKKIQEIKYDPYQIEDYKSTVGIFDVMLYNTWLTGVSSFQRVGNITMKMENNTVIANIELGTRKLEGRTQWSISGMGDLISKVGTTSFSVEYISVGFVLTQPLDTRKRPVLKKIRLEVGNIQVRSDGAGTLDYLIEFSINVLPNLLRDQVIETIEGFLIAKLQEELNRVNVEDVIKENLSKIDEMQASGFKLNYLRVPVSVFEENSDDDFFNF